MKGTAKTIER